MNRDRLASRRWRLADLLDFEAVLAAGDRIDERDRLVFTRDIRPALADLPEARRRSVGLRQWLVYRREHNPDRVWPGAAWRRLIALLRWGLLGGAAVAGAVLVWGLCLGHAQHVHVVIFVGLTVALPWVGFAVMMLLRRVVLREGRTPWLVRLVLRPLGKRLADAGQADRWRAAFVDSRAARRAAGARAAGLLQWGGFGFSLGVALAFLIALMIFDVRFYWEATPDDTGLMNRTVATLSAPWASVWPAAVPDRAAIAASRLSGGIEARAPGGAVAGAWWRFLLMTVLIWGALPRLVLAGVFAWRERRALAAQDFQAPRHRALWRELAGVTRGAVAESSADGALVLDVGGHDIDGAAIRGFLLRRLRLSPQESRRVDVLEAEDEAAADRALAAAPGHVVLVAADWSLSPRGAARLQARVRREAGAATPVTWVVVADENAEPGPPGADHMQRWTAFVDGLRDPATDIVAYDPAA